MTPTEARGRWSSWDGAALVPHPRSSLFPGLQLNCCRDLGVPPVHKVPFASPQKKKIPMAPTMLTITPFQWDHSYYCPWPNSPGHLPNWGCLLANSQTAPTYNRNSKATEMRYLLDGIYKNPISVCKKPVLCDLSAEGFWSSLSTPFKTACASGRQQLNPGSRACEVRQDLDLISSFAAKFSPCNSG